jgi:hypothetical protein
MIARLIAASMVVAVGLVVSACSSGNGKEAGDNDGDGGASRSGSTNLDASMAMSGTSGGSGMDGAETDGATGPDGSSSSGDAALVAMTSPPQVVNPGNGPVLTSPKVQLIGYAEDTFLPDVEAQLAEMARTSTWSQQTSEYGVGALTIKPTITIAGTPPTTLDDNGNSGTPLQTMLANNLSGNEPAWGPADPSTIYLFVLPQGTQVDSGGLCCDPNTGFYGYHYETPVGASSVPYAIVCNCTSLVPAGFTALDEVTQTITHEVDEAATDPFSGTNPAFVQEDQAHAIWEVATVGEIADMCDTNADQGYTPQGSTYMVQRSWSNAAARAGTNPCVPVPAGYGPYFNSYPTLPDTVTLDGSYWTGPFTTPGVLIPAGKTKTIDIVLRSQAPTSGPWTVAAYDLSQWAGDSSQPATQLTLDKSSGQSGDVLHLTIKVLSVDPVIGGNGFVLSSTLDGQNNLWFAAIGQN